MEISLREVNDEDVETFFVFQRDPVSNALAAVPARDHDAHVAHWTKIRGQDTTLLRTIVVDGEVAGQMLSWIDDGGRRLVGYWLGRSFWGRGIASTAFGHFLSEIPERPLFAHVAKHNVGSQRVLEKHGFEVASRGSIVVSDEEIQELVYRPP